MSKIITIVAILVVVILGTALFRINYIQEKLATFSLQDFARLPLSPDLPEENRGILSQNQLIQNQNKMVHLIAVGDIMLSRNVGQKMVQYRDFQYPFLKTHDFLQKADITFGNLESPLISGPPVHSPSMVFRADPECAPALAWAGFDVLSLANNHIMNQGEKGLQKTRELLSSQGIFSVGAGMNFGEAHQYQIIEKKGLRIAFLAYTYPGNPEATEEKGGAAITRPGELAQDLEQAQEKADLVIVSMHAGTEYKRSPNETQVNFAHSAIDLGADLVIGHHPHWFQTVEKYKDKYILYSLGNFVFDQMWSEETREGMIASIYLDQEGVQDLELVPVKIYDYAQPHFVNQGEEKRLLNFLDLDLEKAPLFWVREGKLEKTERQGVYSGKAFAYVPEEIRVDFDHDQKAEQIVWQDNTLLIFQGEEKIWETESDWIVNDYTVADFDQDGSLDLALNLWKKGDYAPGSPLETPENKEHWGSHLFLYNFQEGKPKLVWGSSLLDRPILEIASGDLDSNGQAELVVLEGDYDHLDHAFSDNLSVMSWNEWGFTKDWETKGQYANLRVYNKGDSGYHIYVNSSPR